MKIQYCLVFAALGLAACSGHNENAPATQAPAPQAAVSEQPKPAAADTAPKTPQEVAHAEMVKKAEALTEEQIKQSRDPNAVSKLAQLYAAEHDPQRFGWALEHLTKLLPNSGNLRLQLAMAYSGSEDKTRTYDTLVRLLDQGYAYDIANDERFDNVHGTKVWDYIVKTFQANAKPYGAGKVAFELPKGDTLIESIAWDPKHKRFLAGGVREGKIYMIDAAGKLTDFISADATNGMWAVYGLAVDAAHDKLYAISNGVPYFNGFNADMVGKSGLFEFALSNGKFLHKYVLPEDGKKHILSSIAADAKGDVYVADGVNQEIFRLDNGAIKPVTANPVLTGIRGMAITPDGKTLYFADLSLGIFGIDLGKNAPFSLKFDQDKLALGGIDGLYWYDGTLVAIQNEMTPKRVMRLKLSEDGRSVANAIPLDAAQPAFTDPTVGAINDDGFYFIANSQRGNYDAYGALTQADKLEPVRIYRSNLRDRWDEQSAQMRMPIVRPPTPEELQKMRTEPPKGVIPQPGSGEKPAGNP